MIITKSFEQDIALIQTRNDDRLNYKLEESSQVIPQKFKSTMSYVFRNLHQ